METQEHVDVVVVGSCMKDLQCLTPRLPKPGETIKGHQFLEGYGGKGANQCFAAARLGAKTAMVAKLGNDFNGQSYLGKFKDHLVNVDHVALTDATHTGIATILVDDNGQNSIVIVNGANEHLLPIDVQKAEELIKNSSMLVCQLESNIDATITALKIARKHGVKTLMNAAPATANMPTEIFSLSDIFCVNETEAELLLQHPVSSLEEAGSAACELIRKGCKMSIVTIGEKGAVYVEEGEENYKHISAKPVKAVDTTGAGDAFVGAFAYYLALHRQMSMASAIHHACTIATISVQYPGTHVSYPWKKDLPADMFQ